MDANAKQPVDQQGNPIPVLKLIPGGSKKITTSGSSQQTAEMKHSGIVMIVASEDVYIETGAEPTATSDSMRIPANVPLYLNVGVGNMIAVLQVAVAGAFHYCEVE